MHNRSDKLFPGLQNKLHLLVDAFLACVAVLLASPHTQHRMSWHTGYLCVVAVLTWSLVAAVMRLYSPWTPRRLWDNLILRWIGTVVAALCLACFGGLFVRFSPTPNLLIFSTFFFVSNSLGRVLVFKPLARFGKPQHDILIVGTGHLGVSTYQSLTQEGDDQQYKVVGFVTLPNQPVHLPGIAVPVLATYDKLLEILAHYPVSEVYLAARVTEHGPQMQELVSACERVGMPFAMPLHSLRFERAKLLSSSPARDGYLHYMSATWKPFQVALKRLLDIVASAVALLVLSPLLLLVSLAIKLSDSGPVLFKQKRVGLHGATFDLLKFRSMVVNAEALKDKLMARNEQSGPVFKMTDDPRITSIGRFIRKYSIDELPQLINILRGDMTIVGPRPALPKEVAQYKAWQRRRLSVRPGLTCYWQVGGRNTVRFEDWMRLDLRYVDNWNLAVDMQLILQTFPAVLAGRGAS